MKMNGREAMKKIAEMKDNIRELDKLIEYLDEHENEMCELTQAASLEMTVTELLQMIACGYEHRMQSISDALGKTTIEV